MIFEYKFHFRFLLIFHQKIYIPFPSQSPITPIFCVLLLFFFRRHVSAPPTFFGETYGGRLHVFVAKEIFSWSKGNDPRGCQVPEQPRLGWPTVLRHGAKPWKGSPPSGDMDGSAMIFKAPSSNDSFTTMFADHLRKSERNKTNNLQKKNTHGKKLAFSFLCWYLTFWKVQVLQTFYINLGLLFLRFGPKLRWRRKKLQFFIFRNGKNHHISAWCVRKAQPSTRNYQIIK